MHHASACITSERYNHWMLPKRGMVGKLAGIRTFPWTIRIVATYWILDDPQPSDLGELTNGIAGALDQNVGDLDHSLLLHR